MKFSTRQIVVSGLLTALTVTLGATGWGFLPVPTPAGAATLMHIPVIIAGVLEGPIVGGFVGLLFGIFTLPFLGDPRVVIPARLLIGVASWLSFKLVRKIVKSDPASKSLWGSLGVAGLVAGAVGTATNTVGTLVLAVYFGYITRAAAWGIALAQGIPEMLLAALIVGFVVVSLSPLVKRGKYEL